MDLPNRSFEHPRRRRAAFSPLALAVTALERASASDARLAFEDAVAVYARAPSAENAQKVHVTMRALQHHQRPRELALQG